MKLKVRNLISFRNPPAKDEAILQNVGSHLVGREIGEDPTLIEILQFNIQRICESVAVQATSTKDLISTTIDYPIRCC